MWHKTLSRDRYFINELKKDHEIHVLTWRQRLTPRPAAFVNPRSIVEALDDGVEWTDGVCVHHYPRINLPSFLGIGRWLNSSPFARAVHRIVAEYDIEILIYGPSSHLHGLPPTDLGIPAVFDYSDFLADSEVKAEVLRRADLVICASKTLLKEASTFHRHAFYLPNGVQLDASNNGESEAVRRKLGIGDAKVVSLIGLTTSPSFFILDTVRPVKRAIGNVKYLFVGENHFTPTLRRSVRGLRDVIVTGWVNDALPYFALSDVGTYPTDQTPYDNARCPIKILEYSVLGKPVVSTDLDEVRRWGLPNVLLSKPEPHEFAAQIIRALTSESTGDSGPLHRFNIRTLSKTLENHLESLLARRGGN